MNNQEEMTLGKWLKNLFIGQARRPDDPKLFQKISLMVFFAWVGLGADGLSSSCYGPEEAFLALGNHISLGIFVALASAITIFVISSSYSQIIELFPTGGGSYVVTSKLLSPSVGMVSGCALLIDYTLTITISVAAGADALFSFLPSGWYVYKLEFAVVGVLALVLLNLRGVKESVTPLIPIFLTFLVTHTFIIVYILASNLSDAGSVVGETAHGIQNSYRELGLLGMFILIMRAYSMGAGTYTGIEAVSNSLPLLREPRVETGKRTMRYMATSLAFMAVGLMLGYLLLHLEPHGGKTLNAVLLERATAGWGTSFSYLFVTLALVSAAALLFIAAQTGFLGGPQVLSNMAQDRWFPSYFAILSDRFVIQNGVLLMGIASLVLMIFSQGSVRFLVILYSINVFITFSLSQLGMVRYWWRVRGLVEHWKKRLLVNGFGLVLTIFILLSVIIIKFDEGGWLTLFITGVLVVVAALVRRYYQRTRRLFARLDELVKSADSLKVAARPGPAGPITLDTNARTAVLLVNGYNGLGLHTLFNVIRLFGSHFKNFVFIQVGMIDAGNFKGKAEIDKLKEHVNESLKQYVDLMQSQGFYAESFSAYGTDVVAEISGLSGAVFKRFPQAVFFGGQAVFPKESVFTRLLHNYTIFAVQRELYHQGIPFLVMPIRVI